MSFSKGYTPWNKNKTGVSGLYKRTDEIKNKISSSLMGNIPWNKGIKQPEEDRKKKKCLYRRKSYVEMRYGVSVEILNKFVDDCINKNGMKCEICGRTAEIAGRVKQLGKRRLVVDHDHKTGKLRGMLCDLCNTAIGKLGDDINILKSAIKYLSKGD